MKHETKVMMAFIAVCFFWGTTYLAIRIGVSEMPPELFAGLRFIISGLIILGFAYFKGLKFPGDFKEVRNNAIVGLFLLLGGNGLVVWAEQWVHSGIASLIIATVPLFMALVEIFLPDSKKISFRGWLGLIIGFAGVFLLVASTSHTGTVDIKGTVLLLAASFFWAVGSVFSKSFEKRASFVTAIGIQMLAGGLALCTVGILLGEVGRMTFSLRGLGAMLYLIIFGSIGGYGCYIYVLQNWPAARAGTYAYVNPVVAIFLGWLILNEPLTLFVIIAAAIILAGVVLVQTEMNTEREKSVNLSE